MIQKLGGWRPVGDGGGSIDHSRNPAILWDVACITADYRASGDMAF